MILILTITIQSWATCILENGLGYPLPPGSNYPEAIIYTPNDALLITANAATSNISRFHVDQDILFAVQSYNLQLIFNIKLIPYSLTVSPDGSTLYVASYSPNCSGSQCGQIDIFVIKNNTLVNVFRDDFPQDNYHNILPTSVLSPSGIYYMLYYDNGYISMYSYIPNYLRSVGLVTTQCKEPAHFAFFPNELYFAVACTDQAIIELYSFDSTSRTFTFLQSLPLPSGTGTATDIAMSNYGDFIITSHAQSNSIVFTEFNQDRLFNPKVFKLPSSSQYPIAISLSNSNQYLATANRASGDITIFEIDSQQGSLNVSGTYNLPKGCTYPTDIQFAPDDSSLATGNNDMNMIAFFGAQGCNVSSSNVHHKLKVD